MKKSLLVTLVAVISLLQFFVIKATVKTAIDDVLEEIALKKAREEKEHEAE